MSIGWTLAGLLLAFVEWITGSTGPGALVVHSIVLIYFVNAARAVYAFERLRSKRPLSERLNEEA